MPSLKTGDMWRLDIINLWCSILLLFLSALGINFFTLPSGVSIVSHEKWYKTLRLFTCFNHTSTCYLRGILTDLTITIILCKKIWRIQANVTSCKISLVPLYILRQKILYKFVRYVCIYTFRGFHVSVFNNCEQLSSPSNNSL